MNEYRLINADSRIALDELPENSVDGCVCDPPYGLTSIGDRFGDDDAAPAQFGTDGAFQRMSKGFMGATWDGQGIEKDKSFWKKVHRVLKPGAFLMAFGGTRTFHRIASAIEDAGFNLKDTLCWCYATGFAHGANISLNIDKMAGKDRNDRAVEYAGTSNSFSGERINVVDAGIESVLPPPRTVRARAACAGHVVHAPRPFTRKALQIYLHECAHVALGHCDHNRLKRYEREFQAEQQSFAWMREAGIPVPRASVRRAKFYVASTVNSARRRRNAKPVAAHISRWAFA